MDHWAKVRIVNSGGKGRDTKVELNGVDISPNVTRVSFDADADDVCRIDLFLVVGEVEIDGVAKLRFGPNDARDLLIQHGWTPPPGILEA